MVYNTSVLKFATTGMGENSPTTYSLQGSSLKTWVNFHPGRIPRQICKIKCKKLLGFFVLFFCLFIFHKRAQSSTSTRGENS